MPGGVTGVIGEFTGAYRALRRPVDLGPVDRRTFDFQESVEELLEAIEIFSGCLRKQKKQKTNINFCSNK